MKVVLIIWNMGHRMEAYTNVSQQLHVCTLDIYIYTCTYIYVCVRFLFGDELIKQTTRMTHMYMTEISYFHCHHTTVIMCGTWDTGDIVTHPWLRKNNMIIIESMTWHCTIWEGKWPHIPYTVSRISHLGCDVYKNIHHATSDVAEQKVWLWIYMEYILNDSQHVMKSWFWHEACGNRFLSDTYSETSNSDWVAIEFF